MYAKGKKTIEKFKRKESEGTETKVMREEEEMDQDKDGEVACETNTVEQKVPMVNEVLATSEELRSRVTDQTPERNTRQKLNNLTPLSWRLY